MTIVGGGSDSKPIFDKVDVENVAYVVGIDRKKVKDVLFIFESSPDIAKYIIHHPVTDEIVIGWIFAELFWMLPIGGIPS